MLIIGYSTFFVLVIRANTNTPLNENAPKDAVAMRAYLGREQYGDTPFLTGQYYTAGDPIDAERGYTKYVRGTNENGKDRYIPASYQQKFVYRQNHTGVFPRMYSNDNQRHHPQYYEYWAGKVSGDHKPSAAQNLKYFHGYQMGFMYWRYFMWNFAGRQNDIQGHYFNTDGTRDYMNGNWICGIKAIDEARLGPQDNLPDHMKNNKARNVYYLLPLLLGIVGLVYHIRKKKKDAFIVFIMFFMTGIAIGIYLNMPPRQPRERDYAFVGSFSFFAIWIGLGVMGLAEWISALFKKNKEKVYKVVMPVVFVLCMAGVPCLMACQNWDDHDRSEKTAARDFAQNYLQSVKKNGVLITFGDNDTFPLWYAQEVEGTRTDVRILNFTLSGMYWYVEQLYNKLYDSEALPFTLPKEYYGLGRDQYYVFDNSADYLEVTEVLGLLRDHPERFTIQDPRTGDSFMGLPTKRFKITLDIPALVEAGVIPAELADQVNPEIRWELKNQWLYRHELMLLDILGTNKFKRDINVMNPGSSGIPDVFPLVYSYTIQDGLNYKFIPYPKNKRYTDQSADYFINGVNGEPLKWGNLDRDIYVDPVSRQQFAPTLHQNVLILAYDEMRKGNEDKSRRLLEMYDKNFPDKNFSPDVYAIYVPIANNPIDVVAMYRDLYGMERAREQWDKAFSHYSQMVSYLGRFQGEKAMGVRSELQYNLRIMGLLGDIASGTLKDEKAVAQVDAVMAPFKGLFYE